MSRTLKSRSVSIRDVAALAGVSLGSASRVINNVENVTAATREKVEWAIEQLGYRPNHAAQSLRLRASRTIGVMLTDVTNPLYAKLFRALEERFIPAGYMLLLANGLNNTQRELDILAMFKSRGMDGVILAPGNERQPAVLAAVQALEAPVVILDRDMPLEGKDCVLFDHVAGMHVAVSRLVGYGHRRIALVLGQTPDTPERRPIRSRIGGFRQAFDAHGLPVPEDLIVLSPSTVHATFHTMSALLRSADRPTAIIAQGTNILHECLNAIRVAPLRIPDDITVVSIGDPDFARTYMPPLCSIRIDLQEAARACGDLLLARIQEKMAAAVQPICVAPQFVLRQSCGTLAPPARNSDQVRAMP